MKYIFTFEEKAYGKELFGEPLGGKFFPEKNTKRENEIIDLIKRFTSISYGENVDPNFVNALEELKASLKDYPEVLIPESIVYRGIKMKLEKLMSFYNEISKSTSKYDKSCPKIFKHNYIPDSTIQSWTDNKDSAMKFYNRVNMWDKKDSNKIIQNIGELIFKNQNVSVDEIYKLLDDFYDGINDSVYQALLKNNIGLLYQCNTKPGEFLFKGKYFNKLSSSNYEFEVLRISKEPIICDAVTTDPYLLSFTIPYILEHKKELEDKKPPSNL